MWLDTFRELRLSEQTLDSVLLQDRLPLALNGSSLSTTLLERASGLLAARLPVQLAPGEKRRLVFLLPNATQSLGRFLAVSLLLADFVHRHGKGALRQEKGKLIHGDLLLVTQRIRDCVNLLRGLAIKAGSEALSLTDFWPVEVISQYSSPATGNPRVFVANPGWSSAFGTTRTFGSVVIDASHPRTAAHLDEILAKPSVFAAPVQILVIPPCEQSRLDALQDSSRHCCLAWAWDPAALYALADLGRRADIQEPAPPERHLWVCDDDEVDQSLSDLHRLLVGSMKAGKGRIPSPVLEAWAVYHRLRQLAVPLLQLEEERKKAYKTVTLKDRLSAIEEYQPTGTGQLGAYLDSRWSGIVRNLQDTYQTLLRRKEPTKFYTLASVIEEHLQPHQGPETPVRIVAPTTHEASMVAALLGELVDGWRDALQSGTVTVSTAREEPRLVAEGIAEATVLLGFRTSETRYLDVYPGVPVHVVCYPYEVEVDGAIQQRVHASIEQLQDNASRTTVLRSLHCPTERATTSGRYPANSEAGHTAPRSSRASVRHRGSTSPKKAALRQIQDTESIEPLDIEKLAGLSWWDDIVAGVPPEGGGGAGIRRSGSVELVEIVTTTGERIRYPATRLLDVFYPATEVKERISAGELRPGVLLVMLVDDPYEDLFHRLLEAIREQRDLNASMHLELWQRAKQAALTRHGGVRRRLHDQLSRDGLKVEYEATVGWYAGGEDEIIAPLSRTDFGLLAHASGIYTAESIIDATFATITSERNVRRRCGKSLNRLLASIAAGQNFETALASAKVLGTPVEHVASAVVMREVEAVHRLGKLSESASELTPASREQNPMQERTRQ